MKSKLNIKTILVVAIIGTLTLILFSKSFAANVAKVSVDIANVRKTADTNSTIVEQATKGESVEILEKADDWYKVRYNRIEGYIRKDLLDVVGETNTEKAKVEETTDTSIENTQNKETTTATTTETASSVVETTGEYVCKENTKLKIIPLITGNVIKEIKQGSKMNVLEINNKWALVESESVRGWVLLSKIEKANSTQIATTQETAEVEKTEEKEQETQTQVQEEQTEKIEEKQEEQVVEQVTEQVAEQVAEQNQEAQTVEQAQTTFVEKTMYINSEIVNLRADATTASESLAKLTIATEVTVVSESNGWSKVKVNGKEGFVASTLLSERKPEVITSRSLEEPRQEINTATDTTTQATETTEATKSTKSTKSTETTKSTTTTKTTTSGAVTGAAIVEKAKSYIGYKYVYGGSSPSGFDCSGFVQYIYKQFGISLNRTATAQYSNGVSVSKANLQLGDLVMFGSSSSDIFHVGIYMGNGKIVHAANPSRGVTTDTINSGYYKKHYYGARRIIN